MAFDPSLFGEAKQQITRHRNFKLVKGDNIYRIGPAFRSLAASGKWFFYTRQHFGYRSSGDETNPKGFVRTFLCPLEIDRQTEMVKVPCAECAKIEQMEELRDRRYAQLTEEGKSEAQINTILGPVKEWLKEHNVDKKYNVLAKNQQGEWGVLALPYKAKEALDALERQLRSKEGISPLAMTNGLWLNFTREGDGFKTTYGCVPVYEQVDVNGRLLKDYKRDSLTEKDFEAMQNECPDLSTIGRKLSQEQINALVECNGDPEEVDRIFNEGKAVRKEASPVREATPRVVQKAPVPAPVPIPEPEPIAKVVPAPVLIPIPDVVDEEEELEKKLAAARARKAALKPQAVVETPVVDKQVDVKALDVKALPDEEFFKLFPRKA